MDRQEMSWPNHRPGVVALVVGVIRHMSLDQIMRAPLGVQLNRVAFLLYAIFFTWPLWSFRHSISVRGLFIFGGFVFCGLLGFGYTFVRVPRSRWVLAILGLLIPAAFWFSMCLLVFSRPA